MNEHLLEVPGVSCGQCVNAICSAVGALPGVTDVRVDLATRTVQVRGGADLGAIRAAISGAGYEVAG